MVLSMAKKSYFAILILFLVAALAGLRLVNAEGYSSFSSGGSGNGATGPSGPSGPAGSSGNDCMVVPMLQPCNGVAACTFLSGNCTSDSNQTTAETVKGSSVPVNMDIYKYFAIATYGRNAAGQTGTVTVRLKRDGTNLTSLTWTSGDETCASRVSATSDQSAQTGTKMMSVSIENSQAGNTDDPAYSTVLMWACRSTFSL